MSDYEIITVFESAMLVDRNNKLSSYFNCALLNHIIQFNGEDWDESFIQEMDLEDITYRVTIEKKKT